MLPTEFRANGIGSAQDYGVNDGARTRNFGLAKTEMLPFTPRSQPRVNRATVKISPIAKNSEEWK